MDWNFVRKQNGSSFAASRTRFALPAVVFEIEPGFVVGAHLDVGGRSIRRISTRELEPQSLNPTSSGTNIANVENFRRAVQGVSDVLGNGSGRLGLLLPDASVRVTILIFEALDEEAKEADALVRWRMKEILPYPPEEARLSCQVLWKDPGNVGVMAVAARTSLLAEYQGALGLGHRGPELILPSTLALMPLLPEKDGEAQILVHVCSGWVTTVVAARARIQSWRNKELSATAPEELSQEVAAEVARVLASSQDHMQLVVNKVLLCARPPASRELAGELSRMIGRDVECLAPGPGPDAKLSAAETEVFNAVGTPIAGLMGNFA
jgi:type IV pilus assembly protein PilM